MNGPFHSFTFHSFTFHSDFTVNVKVKANEKVQGATDTGGQSCQYSHLIFGKCCARVYRLLCDRASAPRGGPESAARPERRGAQLEGVVDARKERSAAADRQSIAAVACWKCLEGPDGAFLALAAGFS